MTVEYSEVPPGQLYSKLVLLTVITKREEEKAAKLGVRMLFGVTRFDGNDYLPYRTLGVESFSQNIILPNKTHQHLILK